jgi:hypothetical protein
VGEPEGVGVAVGVVVPPGEDSNALGGGVAPVVRDGEPDAELVEPLPQAARASTATSATRAAAAHRCGDILVVFVLGIIDWLLCSRSPPPAERS